MIRRFELQVRDGESWKTITKGTTCGDKKTISFGKPVKGQVFRLDILEADEVPAISEFQLFE